jgi:tripartite-type tricarboxylate transporter receptor subunit TctC
MLRKAVLSMLSMVLVVSLLPFSSQAKDYPTKPVEILIHLVPGTTMDIMARLIADKAPKYLGQPVIAVNRPGGGGSVAAAEIVSSKPDGYKILYLTNIYFAITTKTQKIPFDPNSIIPIMNLTQLKDGIGVKSDSPWKTFQDMVDYAKKNPGKMRWAHSGRGTRDHIGWSYVFTKAGVETTDLPYGGSPEKLAALLGGHVDASCMAYAPIKDHIKAGKLRYLAVSSAQRYSDLPDVPSIAEAGFPEMGKLAIYTGFYIHKDTPPDVKKTISDAFGKVTEDPEFKKTVEKLGEELKLGGPDFIKEAIKGAEDVGIPIVKQLGLYKGK